MIAGHYGLAAAVKGKEIRTPLWALMLATVWLDVLFVPLVLAGVESIAPVPGTNGGYGQVIIHADYTHSLVGALVLAIVFGAVAAIPWGRRVGTVLGAVVFSHWLLDLVVHRADMPLLPGDLGNFPRLGFGLWRLPAAAAIVELALVAIGAWLYLRAASSVAAASGPIGARRAALLAGTILAAGVFTLAVDVLIG
ncbi:MAG: permease [Thermomicrobiales bacterium]|nr:permease [Thermomicrobiales bacterium]